MLAGACLAALGPLAGAEVGAAGIASPAAPSPVMRVGYSSTLLKEVNENDAKAAMKIHTQFLAEQNGVTVQPDPLILNGLDAIAESTAPRNQPVAPELGELRVALSTTMKAMNPQVGKVLTVIATSP
jgi:hypothetical protein